MAANPKDHLSIDVEPELRQQIEHAASTQNISMQDYIVSILRRAMSEDENETDGAAWGRLSARSFARDWASDEDAVYDALS